MFDAQAEASSMDFQWLAKNGWEVAGNLAYRHLLYEMNTSRKIPCLERIEQILLSYHVENINVQKNKIIEALTNLIELKKAFQTLN
jgi:hypothetical protein